MPRRPGAIPAADYSEAIGVSNATESLRRKIGSAGDLQGVVRTMKTLAASSIAQYERSGRALADYYRTVELGLVACFRASEIATAATHRPQRVVPGTVEAVVFGSDQGMVGQFNDVVVESVIKGLADAAGRYRVWAVGERVYARLADAGLKPFRLFTVPHSVGGIGPLMAQILVAVNPSPEAAGELLLFYNHPVAGAAYAAVCQKVLPLDVNWSHKLAATPWPTHNLPEVLGQATTTVRALIREYLFISLFRACAESLASENASRLAAMERADRNIDQLLTSLQGRFHRLRQSDIDEELFDVISGFEALTATLPV
jgi:F-type H+-transporting ATPase subunit gamma